MTLLSVVSVHLVEPRGAQVLYEHLLPWHAQVTCVGPTTTGPVSLYLGMLATALGRYHEAEGHFDEALDVSRNLRAPLWTATAQFELARMLRRRAEHGDDRDSKAMLTSALDTARRFGFAALEQRAESLL
jgi:hypothetical protein